MRPACKGAGGEVNKFLLGYATGRSNTLECTATFPAASGPPLAAAFVLPRTESDGSRCGCGYGAYVATAALRESEGDAGGSVGGRRFKRALTAATVSLEALGFFRFARQRERRREAIAVCVCVCVAVQTVLSDWEKSGGECRARGWEEVRPPLVRKFFNSGRGHTGRHCHTLRGPVRTRRRERGYGPVAALRQSGGAVERAAACEGSGGRRGRPPALRTRSSLVVSFPRPCSASAGGCKVCRQRGWPCNARTRACMLTKPQGG